MFANDLDSVIWFCLDVELGMIRPPCRIGWTVLAFCEVSSWCMTFTLHHYGLGPGEICEHAEVISSH